MVRIRPQEVSPQDKGFSKRRLYATVCYYYPRYSLKEVERMNYRDIILLLETAKRQQASLLYSLTLIAQAPHSKQQRNVKKLLEQFKKNAGIR